MDKNIYNINCEFTPKGCAMFELKSWIGRTFRKRNPPAKGKYLHLGCGINAIEGFVNADFFQYRGKHRLDWMWDFRYPLPCPDNRWEGVFTEHTLEHLTPYHVRNLLAELRRTTQPGGVIRVVVPDLSKYIDYYNDPEGAHENFRLYQVPAEGLRSLSQNWMHRSLWDFSLFAKVARDAGFTDVRHVSFGQGSNPELLLDQEKRAWESLYVELISC